jgi:hypothetical protein
MTFTIQFWHPRERGGSPNATRPDYSDRSAMDASVGLPNHTGTHISSP